MSKGLTVGDLIEALKRFPKDWPVHIGMHNSDDMFAIKGILDCSESEYGYILYSFVQIDVMTDLDVDDLNEGKVKLYGDREWYNTKDTFEILFPDLSKVRYTLSEKGEIIIKECKNRNGEDISLDDIDEEYEWKF